MKKKNGRQHIVSFINSGVEGAFLELQDGKFEDLELFTFINRAMDNLKEDPFCGIQLSKRLWPKEFVQKYRINNLWKYDLPNAWRLIYFLDADNVKIAAVILEWLDHKKYERRFGYG